MSEGAHTARLARTSGGFLATAARYGAWVVLAALLLTLPKVLTSGFALTLLCLMGISIIFALSYNMLLGQTGMLSFGHAVYYGLGGFLVVHAMNTITRNSLPIPLPVMPLVGGFAGLLFGIVFGSVSTRRGGTAFAMISLGLSELVASSALILRSFFGGEEGITTNRTKLLHVFDWGFGPQIQVYYLIAFWCFVSVLAMYALTRTPFGRMCNAVRDNFERAEFVGYNPQLVRFIAFCLAGFFAGIAGGLAAINFEIVNSSYVGAEQSGTVLLAAYIGGIGFFSGPIIGAVLVTWLQVMLSDITEVWQLYFGLLFVGMVMFAPFGIAGLLMMHAPLWRARVLWRLVPAYLLALAAGLVMLAGASMLIEMAYHLSTKATDGPMMSFMHIAFSVRSFLPWGVAVALLTGGYFAFRRCAPYVEAAWHDALMKARERGSAA
ncbi:MAG TPA: branched-chain amino acid ABC transporter permease [Xanthobacteraceae bacterium]|nr:branched-chain amino acid ABC transporter permease [Xanthobacteraceae bacterium]